MSNRNKFLLLAALVLVFVVVNLRNLGWSSSPSVPAGNPAASSRSAKPESRIPDADLRLQWLEASSNDAGGDPGRNIFEYGHAPASDRPVAEVKPEDTAPPPPPPPPPAPVRFYGFAEPSASGGRRVFLTDGEAVFVAKQGDVILRKYRLARVGKDSVDIEEISGENRWTVKMEQP